MATAYDAFFTGLLVGASIGLFIGFCVCISTYTPNDQLIDRGCKHYDRVTGKLVWTHQAVNAPYKEE